MLERPSQRALQDLARIGRTMAGEDTVFVQYLLDCREALRDELENTQDDARTRQLQGGAQVLSQLIRLCQKAPEAVGKQHE